MSYASVSALFTKRYQRTPLGDIPLLNSCLHQQATKGDPTSPQDVEALLLDLCFEYSEYRSHERREILKDSIRRGSA